MLLGIFGGLTASIESSGIAANMSSEQIDSSLIAYVEKMQTTTLDIPPEHGSTSKSDSGLHH